jgi:hypothetical protein
MKTRTILLTTLGAAGFGLGCSDATAPTTAPTTLLSVSPTGGETGVDPQTGITMQFGGPMQMTMYVALHRGADVAGPLVDGTWSWSADRTSLTFTPAMPLESGMSYTLHIGGAMMDADGHVIDLEQHGPGMGGSWVTQQMMDQRSMQGGMMMNDMTGPGWQHANGTYGMVFTFATA